MTTKKELQTACDKIKSRSLREAVDLLIDSARINAEDSLIEGAITMDGYEACFIDSLVCHLSSREASPKAVAWFAKHGVRA